MTRNNICGMCLAAVLLLAGCEMGDEPSYSTTAAWRDATTAPASQPMTAADDETEPALPVLSEQSTLNDYLAYAAMDNPGLQAAFNRWKAAMERVPQVKSLPDPRFTYRYFIQEVETRNGNQRQSFGASQMFPWLGKLALRGNAAAQAAQAEYQRYQATKWALFYRVEDAYCEYYFLARAVAVTRENIDLLKHIESVTRTRYQVAAASHPDVVRTQVELGKLEDRLKSLLALREPVAGRLNAAMNRPVTAELPWPTDAPNRLMPLSDEAVLQLFAKNNPELKAMTFEIERAKTRISLAKQDYIPDVTIGVDYIDNEKRSVSVSDNGKDPVIAMVSVNVPIWQDKLAAGVREAKQRRLAAIAGRTEKANTLSADLQMALYRFRDAERKINLYHDTLLPKADESIKVNEAAFRSGKGSFNDMIDAQRVRLEFQLAYERALAYRAQRLAEMEMLVGRSLTDELATDAPTTQPTGTEATP